MTQIMKLAENDFKAAVLTMINDVKENVLTMMKIW